MKKTPPLYVGGGGGIGITLSVCSSVCVSNCVLSVSPELLNLFFLTKLGVLVYYHEVMCLVEKNVHYLQCQGHSMGLDKQNMTISIMSSKLQFHLQPNLV